jgi:imidazolonepropionase-like amidohydrolase
MDLHTHLFLDIDLLVDGSYDRMLLTHSESARAHARAARARQILDHGVTTVRDVCTEGAGYADVALRDAIAAGQHEGPRIFPSGPGIGITGGYMPALPPGPCRPSGCTIVDGPDEARKAVRTQVAHGAVWIKIFADWSVNLAGVRPTFTRPELDAIVDEAARRGRRVCAHATSDLGARLAIDAGVASIEHLGTLSRETCDRAAERGVFIVPTLAVAEYVGQKRPTMVSDRQVAFVHLAASGARIANGSDIGAYPHDLGPLVELRLLIKHGLGPLGALRAATRDAAALLGQPELGAIAPGKIADLCAWSDLSFEQKPSVVMKGGAIIRRR